MCLKKLINSILHFAFAVGISKAQPVKNVSFGLHYGSVFAHSQEVQNTKGANPVGLEFIYAKADTSLSTYNICKCNTQQGINLVYFNYDNKILGHALALNYVFEPIFNITANTALAVKGQFGFAYQSNPYHPVKNPNNMSYSLPVSFYAGLSLGTKYLLNKKFQVGVYGNYLHTSNGGIKDPNKGVNWPTANIMLTYFLTPINRLNYYKQQLVLNKKIYYEVFTFYSSRTTAIGQKDRYSIFGISANMVKPLSGINGIFAGIELYNDLSVAKRLNNDKLNNISSIRNGVMMGNVFLLGKINFSQQLGYYIYSPSPYFSSFYHRYMLNYQTKRNVIFGLSMKAHAQVANFVDIRLGYRFR